MSGDLNGFLNKQSREVVDRAVELRRQRNEAAGARRRSEETAEEAGIREWARQEVDKAPSLSDEHWRQLSRMLISDESRAKFERDVRDDVAEARRQVKADRHAVPINARLGDYAAGGS